MSSPHLLMLLLLIGMSLALRVPAIGNDVLHPVILIPGSGGNQLEGRLTEAYRSSSLLCEISRRRSKWFRLWFDPSVLLAPLTRCFAERMTLFYDEELDDYRNAPGVETRVPWFGSTKGLLYLDDQLKHITAYMATLVNKLEQMGYADGENLYGAPYDFRYGLAAEGHPSKVGSGFLRDLKQLIETASSSNDGKPVILLSHSLGGLFALQLLNRNSKSWRDKFIKHLITLSAPWGGTVQEMLTFASGYTLGIPIVDPLLVRGEQRSSESNLWLLPSPKIYGNKTLVITNNKSYSSMDMEEFLEDIGFEEGVKPYNTRIEPLLDQLGAPNVLVTCFVGCGVDTPEVLGYCKNGFDVQPQIVGYSDGDGTVNLVSLLALESQWTQNERELLKVKKINGVSHTSILKDDVALQQIAEEICQINSAARFV